MEKAALGGVGLSLRYFYNCATGTNALNVAKRDDNKSKERWMIVTESYFVHRIKTKFKEKHRISVGDSKNLNSRWKIRNNYWTGGSVKALFRPG
jgi:hypothetical protein